MESEQLQNFNERLNQWVANQGFWFQVRYSMSGSGMRGQAMFHLLRMGFRILVFLLIVALGVLVFLVKRSDTERFRSGLQDQVRAGLGAEEVETRGIERGRGRLEINRIAAVGGSDTFFSACEARGVRCRMELWDGLMGVWEPGIVSISRLDMDLRAGSEDEESANKMAEVIFGKSDAVKVESFEVTDATIRWGYSDATRGGIEKSVILAQRIPEGWRVECKGGKFHQNWLRRLDIVELVVVCRPDEVVFEKAEFRNGDAEIGFPGLRVIAGEIPRVEGLLKFSNLPMESILPATVTEFIEGSISGNLRVSGSTNASDGLGFAGAVVLDEKDVITVRERLHLLKALSVVDGVRNYKRIDLSSGSFDFKSSAGGIEISNVSLDSEDGFTLRGGMNVRPPTDEEKQAAMPAGAAVSPWEPAGALDGMGEWKRSDFTLKRAAEASSGEKEGAGEVSLFDKIDLAIENRRLGAQAAERFSRMLRYDGGFQFSIPGDAFDGAEKLRGMHPEDPSTGRIELDVPISGFLYELTLKQAEDLYEQGQR